MLIQDYQQAAGKTLIKSAKDQANLDLLLARLVLGLTEEAGEVAGKFKKYLREDYDLQTARSMMVKELGDVLWYLSQIAESMDISLEEVAKVNLAKLADRQNRGQIHGSGDER